MKQPTYRQLEIRWVNLDSTRGTETKKKRPCVILQSDLVNRGSCTIIVAPILPSHKKWHFAVNLTPTKRNGLDKERLLNLKQLRVVDVSRIEERLGWVKEKYLKSIKKALEIIFDL